MKFFIPLRDSNIFTPANSRDASWGLGEVIYGPYESPEEVFRAIGRIYPQADNSEFLILDGIVAASPRASEQFLYSSEYTKGVLLRIDEASREIIDSIELTNKLQRILEASHTGIKKVDDLISNRVREVLKNATK